MVEKGRPGDFQSGGRGTNKKGALSGNKSTYNGKSHSENIQFVRHWYVFEP